MNLVAEEPVEEMPVTESVARKVLLLDDDPDLKEVLTDYLSEFSYKVVPVSNGVDGVREIMKSDFETIVCDMNMPSLPGDMFYLAVQRMKPHLCPRFLFITGMKGNQKITEFVGKVHGMVLAKPFRMDDLLEMIGFVQMRSALGV
ncbi:MAG: response regulator [Chthoniobacteraceae bacterium]